jgi:hypothetical protein
MVDSFTAPMHEPLAELEAHIIDEYVRLAGYDPDLLRRRTDAEARTVMANACAEATARLAVIECRSRYVRELHGQSH